MTTKVCVSCGQAKPVEKFKPTGPRKAGARKKNDPRVTSDGRRRICHACHRRRTRRNKGIGPKPPKRAPSEAAVRTRLVRQLRTVLGHVFRARCEAEGLKPDTVEYRVRYNTDAAFRAKEVARRWQRKERDRSLVGDGTLTPTVVRGLFAGATACAYCERPMRSREKSLDHVIPLSRGGGHSTTNVVVCCRSCNSRKHARTPEEWAIAGPNQPFHEGPRKARSSPSDRVSRKLLQLQELAAWPRGS
jgi:5-methylcytosine-specific restriction endonuclease McrA